MRKWEARIAKAFMDAFPASAAAVGGRKLRLKTEFLFPGFAEESPDERESFLEAAEALEKRGVLELVWEKRRKGEELRCAVLRDAEGLFTLAGRGNPTLLAEAAREEAGRASIRLSGPNGDAPDKVAAAFFSFLAENLTPEDAVAGIDDKAVEALGRLCLTMDRSVKEGRLLNITPRALSVHLFSDSKRAQALLALFAKPIQRALRAGIPVPDFSPLDRSFPDCFLAGSLVFRLQGDESLSNSSGVILGLPLRTVLGIRSIEAPYSSGAGKLLTVENKESFYALADRVSGSCADRVCCGNKDRGLGGEVTGLAFDAVLYTGGYPNGAAAILMRLLSESGMDVYHAGDLDPDGILILQEVMKHAGKPVQPYGMSAEIFDRYRAYARPLGRTMLHRVSQIRDETRALPGMEALLERILSTALGVEQEVIDYASLG